MDSKGGKVNQAFPVDKDPQGYLGTVDSKELGENREPVDLRGTKGPPVFLVEKDGKVSREGLDQSTAGRFVHGTTILGNSMDCSRNVSSQNKVI